MFTHECRMRGTRAIAGTSENSRSAAVKHLIPAEDDWIFIWDPGIFPLSPKMERSAEYDFSFRKENPFLSRPEINPILSRHAGRDKWIIASTGVEDDGSSITRPASQPAEVAAFNKSGSGRMISMWGRGWPGSAICGVGILAGVPERAVPAG